MEFRAKLSIAVSALVACGRSAPAAPPTVSPVVAATNASSPPIAVAAPPPPAAQTGASPSHGPISPAKPLLLSAKAMPLPGANGRSFLDYIVYERVKERVWVPVGNTGSVDVFDIASSRFARVDGFKTAEHDVRGSKRVVGPSAASVGDGFVYVGNRASSEVCPVDIQTLKLGRCLKLGTPTDGVAYVASMKEVWVTTPRDNSITVLDAAKPGSLKMKTVINVEGNPEGFSVDESRGLFFTNLENKDRTLVLDVNAHRVRATWKPECGPAGPRGIAIDVARQVVFVACTDHLKVLDGARDGAQIGKLDTGAGLDNIDYLETRNLLYAAAGKAARLSIASVDANGQPELVATGTTTEGARNAVADASGNAYVADPVSAQLLIFALPRDLGN